jgi:hypothetical protein
MFKKIDVKSILTLWFAALVGLLTVALVIHAIVVGDVSEAVINLLNYFTAASISALSLALGYFFGRTSAQKEDTIKKDDTVEK